MVAPKTRETKKTIAAVGFTLLAVEVCLLVASVALFVVTLTALDEIKTNREIGCIGRYLDNQDYAPACEPFIEEYKDGQ